MSKKMQPYPENWPGKQYPCKTIGPAGNPRDCLGPCTREPVLLDGQPVTIGRYHKIKITCANCGKVRYGWDDPAGREKYITVERDKKGEVINITYTMAA